MSLKPGATMNCPRCGTAIMCLTQSCEGCGYDYGDELYDKFAFYFGLKDELDKLMQLQNSLYAGIANVSQKIQKYEEVLRCDLASAPDVKIKKSAREKRKRR